MPDLLPPNATPQERALSLATDRLPDVPIRTLWSPQTCPEAQLPWLAWALSVDEWDSTWPVETKRQVIAASVEQHRQKGTIGALRRALQKLGYEVIIDERTGTAYTFRLRVRLREGQSAGGAVTTEATLKAQQIALRTKNARSSMLTTTYLGEGGSAGLFIGGVHCTGLAYELREGDEYTPPPSGVSATSTQTGKFSAEWNGNGEFYEWRLCLAGYPDDIYTSGTAYSESIDDITAIIGSFTFQVRAFASGQFSSWVSVPLTINIQPPANLVFNNATAGEVTFSWDADSGYNPNPAIISPEYQLCVAGNNWVSLPFANDQQGVSFDSDGRPLGVRYYNLTPSAPLPAGFYDFRVRWFGNKAIGPGLTPNANAFSAWTQLLNIAV